jgi:hypothetical protein
MILGDAWGNYYKINPVTEQRDWFKLPGWLQQYCEVTLPVIDDHPTGYHAFQNQQSIIQGTKDSSGNYTMASWYILFFCNLMGTNIHDLNDVVDDTLQYVFGDVFEAAADRAASLPSNTSFSIEKAIAKKLFVETIFEDGDSIGSAELDLLFSFLRLIKSSFEWIAAYDLEFDRYVFRLWSEVGGGNFIPLWYDAMNAPIRIFYLETAMGICLT